MQRHTSPSADSATRECLTEAEAAEFLRVSPRTLQRQRAAGTGPQFRRVGLRRLVYTREALTAWLRQQQRD